MTSYRNLLQAIVNKEEWPSAGVLAKAALKTQEFDFQRKLRLTGQT